MQSFRPSMASLLASAASSRITRVVAAVALAFGPIAAATAQNTPALPPGSPTTLKVQIYPGTISAGHPVLWLASDKGFCKARGLTCQLVEIASGPLGLQALASGSIQIAFATTDVAMQAAARGNDIQLIASAHPNRYFTLSARKDVPLPNLAKGYPAVMKDLQGLKIGVTARGSGTEIQTRALLAGAGMKAEDVTFVAVGSPGTAYPAMVAKQIDAAMMFDPFATLCRIQDSCVTAVAPTEGPPELRALNGAVQQLSSTRKFIEANPQVIDAFILAVQDAVTWMRDPANLDELTTISKKYFTMGNIANPDAALKSLLQSEQKTVGATLDRKAVQAHADFLLANKLIDKPFDIGSFVYAKAPKP